MRQLIGAKMSTEVEEGVYTFRVKFMTKNDELEVSYELRRIYSKEDVTTSMQNIRKGRD